MTDLETAARELGFESEEEMHRLIASVDLSTPARLAAFASWKATDGTKAGLARLRTYGKLVVYHQGQDQPLKTMALTDYDPKRKDGLVLLAEDLGNAPGSPALRFFVELDAEELFDELLKRRLAHAKQERKVGEPFDYGAALKAQAIREAGFYVGTSMQAKVQGLLAEMEEEHRKKLDTPEGRAFAEAVFRITRERGR